MALGEEVMQGRSTNAIWVAGVDGDSCTYIFPD